MIELTLRIRIQRKKPAEPTTPPKGVEEVQRPPEGNDSLVMHQEQPDFGVRPIGFQREDYSGI